MTDRELRKAADTAKKLGIQIELGTKGIEPVRLARFLELAKIFDAKLIRSMVYSDECRPSKAEAIQNLVHEIKNFEAAGISLALETYEQISTNDLVSIITKVRSPNLGICLDPANVVARLENPKDCVKTTAHLVKNIHVKDFEFARQKGWVGFTYSGAEMGKGLHDYRNLLAKVNPRERGINEIVEHWLPWQGDIETTVQKEKEWTKTTLEYLRKTA